MTVVGRLAPSPTGHLHLGHARSFLLAWWSARSAGGRVALRIDDLDLPRVVPGSAEAIQEDLTWLGLDWDGEPMFQSTRQPAYQEALTQLQRSGAVYACTCSRQEIASASSAPHGTTGEVRYPGTCSLDPKRSEGALPGTFALRFRVRPGLVQWLDGAQGPTEVDVAETAGDFVVARKDGTASYQLATVLDDAAQGVTEVLRGDDLVPSAARQSLLLDALGLPQPAQIHVPLVVDSGGQRLAKRDGGLTLRGLRDAGITAERICGWVARTVGFTETVQPKPANYWVGEPMMPLQAGATIRLPAHPLADL